ncbi:clathrin heavy chain family protein [Pelomyxa schiedti]|nr:clathrin heavy chain family protein [Pelomyxa schiedti]
MRKSSPGAAERSRRSSPGAVERSTTVTTNSRGCGATVSVTCKELINLGPLGINPEYFAVTALTMESDKHICICEKAPSTNTVTIVDVETAAPPPTNTTTASATSPSARDGVLKISTTANAAIVSPDRSLLVISGRFSNGEKGCMMPDDKPLLTEPPERHSSPGRTLQVYDMDDVTLIKEYKMPRHIVFWKWISNKCLALVTSTTVYHWQIDRSHPTVVFERLPNLDDAQIINYRRDPSGDWLILVGIKSSGTQIVGCSQLHSITKGASQFIEAHAACFTECKVPGVTVPSVLFLFTQRKFSDGFLYILDLVPGDPSNPFPRKMLEFQYTSDTYDFPVGVQVCKQEMAFVITKAGYLNVFQLSTGAALCHKRFTLDTVFLTLPSTDTSAFVAVTRKGQALTLSL